MGGLFQIFWERGGDFQESGHCPLYGLWWLALELSWCLWMCHLACWRVECILKIKVLSKLTHQPSWTHLIQMSLYYVLRLWHHSCKGCALPPSLLFQYLILNQNAYLNFFNLINNMKTGPFHKSLGLLLWVFWGSPPCFDQQPRPRQTLLHAFFFQCQVVAVFFFS